MTNIALLPVLQISAGVQINEDFIASLAVTQADGVTPLSLTGITFTSSIGNVANLTSSSGLTVVGNTVSWFIPAASKVSWPAGTYQISLLATDGTYTKDVFSGNSGLVNGAQISSFTVVNILSSTTASAIASIPVSALIAALTGSPSGVLALAAALAQPIFQAIPSFIGPLAPVPTNQAFVDQAGFYVKAQ